MTQITLSILTILAALITACATIALWRVTKVLADETRRMAAATAQPQVVVSIESNDWSFIHADLRVSNTGNSTAFDIEVEFDPPLVVELENQAETSPTPFQKISLLKPGQELTSWIGKMYSLLETSFTVQISWRRSPNGEREQYSYILDMSTFKSVHRLGSGNPLIQLANTAKNIKEDIHRVIKSGKIQADSYDSGDRNRDRARWTELASDDKVDPTNSRWKKLITAVVSRFRT